MIEITIGNSYSRITGLTAQQFKALREVLSYTVDAQIRFFQGAHRPHRRYLIDSKGNFPTGLLDRVIQHCSGINATFNIKDTRKRPDTKINIKMKVV